MVVNKISDNVYKISNDSNIYYIKDLNIVIDAGNRDFYESVKTDLESVCDLEEIEIVILTHLHYDHIGCFDLFPNAKFYSTKRGVEDYKKDKISLILNEEIANMFDFELHDVGELELPERLEVMESPGHSSAGLIVLDKENKILFSGDTKFDKGYIGRYDLPTSDKEELKSSLRKIDSLDYEVLCPGHDY